MARDNTARKTYRTAAGKVIDMEAMVLRNETTLAVGNNPVNARGDEIGPNGEVIKDIGGYKVQPGDTITVPRDLNKIQPLPLISLLSGVFSDIALAAASLNILRN